MCSVPKACLLAALVLTWAVPTLAERGDDSDDEPVRVYTNADLERLEPIPTQPAEPPSPEEVARRWEFVQSVIDQAYARIDAERRHDLDRRLTEARADALDRVDSRPRYVLPFAYRYPPIHAPGRRGGYVDPDPAHPGARRLWERPNAELFRPITPIHARPYPSDVFRLEARVGGAAGRATSRHPRP